MWEFISRGGENVGALTTSLDPVSGERKEQLRKYVSLLRRKGSLRSLDELKLVIFVFEISGALPPYFPKLWWLPDFW